MGVLGHLAKGDADHVHDLLEGVTPSTHKLTGGIVLTDANKSVLLRETANYHGNDYHVEKDLLARLFAWTKANAAPWQLPMNSRVYLYVYNSPCTACAEILRKARINWRAQGNLTVRWKFGFTVYYLQPRKNGHADPYAADGAYNGTGWTYKRV